jgi:hypothetical protein
LAERWAIEHCFPVRHVGLRSARSQSERDRHHFALLRSASHFVVFSARDKDSEALLQKAKAAGKAVRIVRVDANGRPLQSRVTRQM